MAKAYGFPAVGTRKYGREAEARISAKLRECEVRFLVVAPIHMAATQAALIRELDPAMNDHPGQVPRWRIDEVREILEINFPNPVGDRQDRAVDAHAHLKSLVGQEIKTFRGYPNTVLSVDSDNVWVKTRGRPVGTPVPVRRVQAAMDLLRRDGEVTLTVETLGIGSAFVGAVLATLPGARFSSTRPPKVSLFG